MTYSHTIESCFSQTVGERGLSHEAFERELAKTAEALRNLTRERVSGTRPFLSLPHELDDLHEIREAGQRLAEGRDDILVIGTGGSSLGARTLCALPRRGRQHWRHHPRLHFIENVDPDSAAALADDLDWSKTGLLVVSKSGSTAETLCLFLALLPRLMEAVGESGLPAHCLVISEDTDNPLRKLAHRLALPFMAHDSALGGRFSAFSKVGLLPAAIAGADPAALREGAAEVLDSSLVPDHPDTAPPAVGAALQIGLLNERLVTQSVLMPYMDRLREFTLWYRQLWAESLGKEGGGTTPIAALGTVDQHSQLQLYLDGPADKLFTIVHSRTHNEGPRIASDLAGKEALGYLAGRTMGDLMDAEARSTIETLIAHGRPVREIEVRRLDARTLGGLLMHYMLETVIAAHLLGVDPYVQPAVEEGKRLARQHMTQGD